MSSTNTLVYDTRYLQWSFCGGLLFSSTLSRHHGAHRHCVQVVLIVVPGIGSTRYCVSGNYVLIRKIVVSYLESGLGYIMADTFDK